MNELGALVTGMLLGALALACFIYPLVGRALGKLISVIGISLGTGLIVWGTYSAITGDFSPMRTGPIFVVSISQVIGWGCGLLAGGVTALVLALVGRQSS